MLRAAGLLSRRGYVAAGATAVGAVTTYAAAHSESAPGLERQAQFWRRLLPISADYWWNVSAYSPKVKLRLFSEGITQDDYYQSDERKQLKNELHERNAPKIYDVMVSLGGLYIKLGQVLSVTVLPIPEVYREYFRRLQSDVPGSECFEGVVKPTIEKELGIESLDEVFDHVEPTPVGAASIGQCHRARLKDSKEDVIVKVQYSEAYWQVPADISAVGDFLKLCVWFEIVDDVSSKASYDEFSRQFLAELDYEQEKRNLQTVYESSIDPSAPYIKRNVVVPRIHEALCSNRVLVMSYLPGPKMEQEVRRQLAYLGIDTKKGVRELVKNGEKDRSVMALSPESASPRSVPSSLVYRFISVDTLFALARWTRAASQWSQGALAKAVLVVPRAVPAGWVGWAAKKEVDILRSRQLDCTSEAVDAILDVHGHQIFSLGLFNADPHPGNIILCPSEDRHKPKIGLIDYGQCKRLEPREQVDIAKLLLSIANDEPDADIARNFRRLGIKTTNDSTEFLAEFGRLMFGSLQPRHLDHGWHRRLHDLDRVTYFPKELSLVYRTALLLRGLAMSLQTNVSIGEAWRSHAEEALRRECRPPETPS
mmetsp:Transcript_23374/g.52996  ORF Transcript_23374/g.52996 Transcript_23374/m.52996 type:complete len:595 (-) Transcript_23374:118-1902(-)